MGMRRTWIQHVLPLLFCLFPPLAAVVIALVVPPQAQQFYLARLRESPMDWLILSLGFALFIVQMLLTWRALQWQATGFNEGPDRWLSNLAQAAEWFPLLGLIGTVAGILQTFSSITAPGVGQVSATEVIQKYSPAITATGSGLFMALINILPTWVVLVGRDLIQALGGGPAPPEEPLP